MAKNTEPELISGLFFWLLKQKGVKTVFFLALLEILLANIIYGAEIKKSSKMIKGGKNQWQA